LAKGGLTPGELAQRTGTDERYVANGSATRAQEATSSSTRQPASGR